MDSDLQRLVAACNKAADHYCANPSHFGPETVIDIYRAMAALASMVDDAMRHRAQQTPQKQLH